MPVVADRIGEEKIGTNPLDDLKPGMVIYMDHPKRLVQVEGPGFFQEKRDTLIGGRSIPQLVTVPVVIVKAVIPGVPIKGFVDEYEASFLKTVRESILAKNAPYNDIQWTEKWNVRGIGLLINPEKSPAERSEQADKQVFQLYCCATEGRDPDNEENSPIANKPCSGSIVPHQDVPAGLFLTNEEREEQAKSIAESAERKAKEKAVKDAEDTRILEMWRIKEEAKARVEAEREASLEPSQTVISIEELEELRANQKAKPGRKPAVAE